MKRLLIAITALALLAPVFSFAQTKSSGPEQALMDMETAWAAAFLKGDTAAIEGMLAANFTGVSTDGRAMNRAQLAAEIKQFKITKSANSDMKVMMINPTVAIVTGVWAGAGTDPKGQKFDTSERWTDVFVSQGGQWKCVSSHVTTIAK